LRRPLDIGYLNRGTLLLGKIILYFLMAYFYLKVTKISTNPSFVLFLLALLPLIMTLEMRLKKKFEKELGENFNIKFLKGVSHEKVNTPHDFLQELFSNKLDEAMKGSFNFLSSEEFYPFFFLMVFINWFVFPSVVLEFTLKPFIQQFKEFVNEHMLCLIFLAVFIAVWYQFYLLVENLARNGKNHLSENIIEDQSKSPNEKVKSWLAHIILFILSLENPYGEYIFRAYFGRKTKPSILFFTFFLTFSQYFSYNRGRYLSQRKKRPSMT